MKKIEVDRIWIGGPNDDEDDETNWQIEWIPAKYEVCSSCQGEGKSSAYLGAFTREDLYEAGEEFVEDYFAGRYDKICGECKGERVVLVPDRENADPTTLARYDAEQESCWEMYRMERMAGA